MSCAKKTGGWKKAAPKGRTDHRYSKKIHRWGIPPSIVYPHRAGRNRPSASRKRPSSGLTLASQERQEVLEVHSEEFMDKAPQEVHAALLDRGWVSLHHPDPGARSVGEPGSQGRRNQPGHSACTTWELLTMASNQVWSWASASW